MPRPIKQSPVFEELTYAIIGVAMNVHKELGSVHKEIVYQQGFALELEERKIPFQREVRLPVLFKGKSIGVYIPDFIVDNKVIVEIKAMSFIPQEASVQLSYYFKTTGFRIGLLINFGASKLQVRRRIYG